MSQPEFEVSRNLPLKYRDQIYLSHYTSMVQLILACGANLDSFTLHEMTDIWAFERALSNVCKFLFSFKFDVNNEQN